MSGNMRLGISSCLLGKRVRYDGGHKLDRYLAETLGKYVEWVPICPEVEAGLGVPREAMGLVGDPDAPRLVTRETGIDYTIRMRKWARQYLRDLKGEDLCGFVLKSRSPSCGLPDGIFASILVSTFPELPIEDDAGLVRAARRENFIERIFVFSRWRELAGSRASVGRLVSFHSDHKYLVMAHSPAHLRQLGRLVAEGKQKGAPRAYREYLPLLMAGLKLKATVRKNVNVLDHMMGYFKKFLGAGERQELLEAIDEYHRGLVPLVVPVTLIKHYVRKYEEPFLARQLYLSPHPAELMLKNHV